MGRERGSGRESEVMACVSLALPLPLPLPLLVRARIKINADISHIFFLDTVRRGGMGGTTCEWTALPVTTN